MTMQTLLASVLTRLQADTTLTSILTGKVHGTPIMPDPVLSPDDGPGPGPDGQRFEATPRAFETLPPFRIKPCASVLLMPRVPHPSGVYGMFADMIQVNYYAPYTVLGEEAGYAAMARVRSILDRAAFPDGLGSGWIVEPANDAIPFRRTNEFMNAIAGVERFIASHTGVR